jgi:DNA-binding Lrp family transcriptional regulator
LKLNKIDLEILRVLQENCRIPLEELAKKVNLPRSTVYYKIKKLEEKKIIEGYHAKINLKGVEDYLTITFVRAKYGPGYHDIVGERIAKIQGVKAVYFVFGENDFILLIRSRDREDYLKKLEKIMSMREVERTVTIVVAKVIKEDLRVEMVNGK